MILATIPRLIDFASWHWRANEEFGTSLTWAAFALISVWLWLQWPRRWSAYTVAISAAVILSIRPAAEMLASGYWGGTLPKVFREFAGVVACSSCVAIAARIAIRWRLVDYGSESVNTDLTARSKVSDLLIASLSAAVAFAVFRQDVVRFYGGPRSAIDAVVTGGVTATLTILSLRVLSYRYWGVGALLSLPLLTVNAIVLSFSIGLPRILRRSVQNESFSGDQIVEAIVYDLAHGVVIASCILAFVWLLRATRINLNVRNRRLSADVSPWVKRTVRAFVLAIVLCCQLPYLFGSYGIQDASDRFAYGECGWPFRYESWEQDYAAASVVTLNWNWTPLLSNLLIGSLVAAIITLVLPSLLTACFQSRVIESPAPADADADAAKCKTQSTRAVWQSIRSHLRPRHGVAIITLLLGIVGYGVFHCYARLKAESLLCDRLRESSELVISGANLEGISTESAESDSALISANGYRFASLSCNQERISLPLFDRQMIGIVRYIMGDESVPEFYGIAKIRVRSPSQTLLNDICRLPWLRQLNIDSAAITDEQARALADRGRLGTLRSRRSELPQKGFGRVLALPTLRTLNIDAKLPASFDVSQMNEHVDAMSFKLDGHKKSFAFPPSLTMLNVDACDLKQPFQLSDLSCLLSVRVTNIPDGGDVTISGCRQLEAVKITASQGLVIAKVTDTPDLRFIDLTAWMQSDGPTPACDVDLSLQQCHNNLSIGLLGCGVSRLKLPRKPLAIDLAMTEVNGLLPSEKPNEKSDWNGRQLAQFPDDCLNILMVDGGQIGSEASGHLARQTELVDLIADCSISADAFDEVTGWQLSGLSASHWRPDDKAFAHFVNVSPQLVTLSADGGRLTQIDLRPLAELRSLYVVELDELETLRCGNGPLRNIELSSDDGARFPNNSEPSLRIDAACVDRPMLSGLFANHLAKSVDSSQIELREVNLATQDWDGLDFGDCSELLVTSPTVTIANVKSWRFGGKQEMDQLPAFTLNSGIAVDADLLTHIGLHAPPYFWLLELNQIDHAVQPSDREYQYRGHATDLGETFVSLRGQRITAEMVRTLNEHFSVAELDLTGCQIDTDAIGELFSASGKGVVRLDGADYDAAQLDALLAKRPGVSVFDKEAFNKHLQIFSY
ncbi:hypothetical protein K239x_33760 [Planctomycetes bacterium K23_9]|uniref:Leucine Rich repeats (2 copies) n=2 Tax=Stieleria marina TaxID=1930275 RepID=A0A517NW78_9BACT|nr:hypothetical protein K239x_33760 [Planctomycetes bacterium K23_9]